MADATKRIRFIRNAKDGRSSVPYVAGQEATVLASVAERMMSAGVAEPAEETEEAQASVQKTQEAPSTEQLKKVPRSSLLAAAEEKKIEESSA